MKPRAARSSIAGLLAVSLLSSASALANDAERVWYGSLTGLHNMPSDSEAELGTRSLGTIGGDLELSDETGFALAIGFETGDAQQVELEVAFRSSDIEGASGVRVASQPVPAGYYRMTGDVDTWSLMMNARQLFDVDVGSVRPYIGGGVGFARHDGAAALAIPPIPSLLPTGLEGKDSGDDTVFAYQFMAGVEVELAEGARLFGGYRYMATTDLEIERLTASYHAHAIEAGIRIRF